MPPPKVADNEKTVQCSKKFTMIKQPIRKIVLALAVAASGLPAWSQTCQTGDEIPKPAKTSLEAAAQKTFEQASFRDLDPMQTHIAPAAPASFPGIAAAAK